MKAIFTKTLFAIIVSVSLVACNKFVDLPVSPQLITTSAVFTSDNTAIAAVNGVYVKIRESNLSVMNGGLSISTGLTGDELLNSAANSTYTPYYTNGILATDGLVSNDWGIMYNLIYRTNVILEGLSRSTQLSAAVKSQLSGEMKMARALVYFYLVNLYGDVPLVTTTDYKENNTKPRTPAAQVYEQMVIDLKDAERLLSVDYPSDGKVRPNRYTAAALLSRVYLFQKNWALAEEQASLVIGSGAYQLKQDLNQVFLINSQETIWEIAPANDLGSTAEGTAFIPATATTIPRFSLTPDLSSAFSGADKRKLNWMRSMTLKGITYNYAYKYKNNSRTNVTEYSVVFRLAEQYLIRAEAKAQMGNTLAGAIGDLNAVHTRAGLDPYPLMLSKEQCLSAIEQERRLEFFTEWGHRWFDLKRYGTINQVLGATKANWQATDALFPIPQDQINFNINLVQNPGY
jgi:hypothetical protein